MTLPPRSRTSPGSPVGTSLPSPSTMRSSKPGPRPADRGGDGLDVVVGRGGRGRAGLGEPVPGDDHARTAARRAIRRISSTGMSAAPVTATRRLDRS